MPIKKGYKFKPGRTKHGHSKTKLYKVWSAMKDRCENADNPNYINYGGRGITVCKEWLSFMNFYKDMSNGYEVGLSIDRINNDGNYCKSNCKWATRKEQLMNKRSNIWYTLGSETKSLTQWADEIGISYQSLAKRLRNGWPLEKALTTKRIEKYVTR